jgi:hypothetical protein
MAAACDVRHVREGVELLRLVIELAEVDVEKWRDDLLYNPRNIRNAVRNVADALALLEERGWMTLSQLVTAVVGGPVKGSWWSHPKGKLIFHIANEVERTGDVLVAKLGKVVFMHRTLWPAFLRLVTDPAWRRDAARKLSPAARRLLADVDKAGTLRLDGDKDARAELERSGLVLSTSEHTDKGHHAAVLATWGSWAKADVAAAAGALDRPAAETRLRAAGLAWE